MNKESGKKRIIYFVLSIVLIINIMISTSFESKAYSMTAAATNDYTTWKQTSSSWGEATPWPTASIPKFGDAGCWMTSMAMILRHYNVVTDSNVNSFNPLICNNRLMDYGIVNSSGDFVYSTLGSKLSTAYPGISYSGEVAYSFSKLKSLYDQGYACIVHETRGHYVAVRSVSDSSVTVMDPGYATTALTDSDVIQYYKIDSNLSVTVPTGTQSISDGDYYIASYLDTSYYLNIKDNSTSVGANAQLGTSKQLFTVTYIGDGYYQIASKNSGLNLDVENYGKTNGTNISQYYKTNNSNQKWVIKADSWLDGYMIFSVTSGLVMEVSGGKAVSGANIDTWEPLYNSGGDAHANKKWCFIPAFGGTQTLADGDYTVASGLNSNFYLGVSGSSASDGANIELVTSPQTFTLTYIGDGFYSITVKKSDLNIAVQNYGKVNGSNVIQIGKTTYSNQKWIIKSAGNGNYFVISQTNGLYLEVQGGKATAAANIDTWAGHKSSNQQWIFSKLSDTSTVSLSTINPSVSNTASGVKISWTKDSKASGYYVYRKTGSGNYSKIGTVSNNSTVTYNDSSVISGTTYTYAIRAYNGSTLGKYIGVSIKYLATMPNSSIKLSNISGGVSMKWNAVKGASGYIVYRKIRGGSWKQIVKITSGNKVAFVDKTAQNGMTYLYTVKSYSGNYTSYYSSGVKIVRLNSTSISSLKNSTSKAITVKWKKNSNATGYQVSYSTKSNFQNTKNKTTTSSTIKISNLTKGKTYYIRMRSYKTVDGKKYYSAWSDKKKIKISK